MIIVKIIGGLGNQMFQYALGRSLEKKTGKDLKLDINGFSEYKLHNYGLNNFVLNCQFVDINELMQVDNKYYNKINKLLPNFIHIGYKKVLENSFAYSNCISNLRDNVYLDGYWQSEKYFNSIRNILLEDFKFKQSPSLPNLNILNHINDCNSISVHIRRGDYINNAKTLQKHGVTSLEYYRKAINYIIERIDKPFFFIFSDDINWAKQNLFLKHPTIFVDINNSSNNYEDLRLMKNCKNNIIANSSFSWWGAWLNEFSDKIVVAPKNWFNDNTIETKDIIPENWITL